MCKKNESLQDALKKKKLTGIQRKNLETQLKNKKGILPLIAGLTIGPLIGIIVLILLLVAVIIFGTGLFLNFFISNILFLIGGFLIVIALIVAMKSGKFTKQFFWVVGIGFFLIIIILL